jgi:hypothetical protein
MARRRAVPLVANNAHSKVVEAEPKPAPKIEGIVIPAALLLAAESIASKVDKDNANLQGVMLHQRDTGVARLVAFDGFRTFVGSFEVKNAPSWLKGGIMLEREALKARVNMLVKVAKSDHVVIAYAKGQSLLTMMDLNTPPTMRFEVTAAAVASFPDYEANITSRTFADMDEESDHGEKQDWKPLGFNSKHLSDIGAVASILSAAMDKKDRKDGMTIRMFQASEFAPRVFDFDLWPGTLMIVGSTAVTANIPLLTAKALAPAVKGTLAALRAHETRWRDAAGVATTDAQKEACLAKAASFRLRIETHLVMAQEKPAIAGPAAAQDVAQVEGPAEGEVEEPKRVLTRGERSAETKRKRAEARAAKVVLH